ncbi:hypothetical protein TVAG_251290 [Trichomonas vaginalis G3]|uniref:Uncharacterized protein n=1 Tax=Trichomonas vaginalis (strain ATCC PRA-98 / G3) TaxID=412133 RepID=A2FUZ4_TRIV3|nr:hypothetical protein TVAGG3_0455780 [Trichomonas vaginalis G3]EAX91285.1 hypothetical protein TVAG_251290 [Trichomonas vaginalis G3]KAI5538453.1 hypothetical protein TVAGG3_0455780 [Trichomonas vaginalis G3]|eukprot:XP_001304215.1 hypothetical protein [Trichomonas vaginalis G3]
MMNKYERDILMTRKTRKYKEFTKNIEDRKLTMERMQILGIKLDYVTAFIDREYGWHVTFAHLLQLAEVLHKKLDIQLDRLAKRNRSALLCWYTETWDLIQPKLVSMRKRSNRRRKSIKQEVSSPRNNQICNAREDGVEAIKLVDPSNINSLLNRH